MLFIVNSNVIMHCITILIKEPIFYLYLFILNLFTIFIALFHYKCFLTLCMLFSAFKNIIPRRRTDVTTLSFWHCCMVTWLLRWQTIIIFLRGELMKLGMCSEGCDMPLRFLITVVCVLCPSTGQQLSANAPKSGPYLKMAFGPTNTHFLENLNPITVWWKAVSAQSFPPQKEDNSEVPPWF
jgi:hypothetical protein